ncbi:MAG: YjbF family lipoprotein, partial [Shewanella sp.]
MRINKKILSLLTISAVLIGISGCSQRMSALNDTIKLGFIGDDDVILSTEQIKANPYASIYAKIDDTAQAFV